MRPAHWNSILPSVFVSIAIDFLAKTEYGDIVSLKVLRRMAAPASFESHLLLFNHSAGVKTVAVSIANGLTTWKKLYSIAAFDTRQLSVNQIIQDQVKDDNGKTLDPKDNAGVVLWSTANPGDITGRLLVSNRASAMAQSFSCINTIVLCGLNVNVFDSGLIPIDGYVGYASAQPLYCYASSGGQCNVHDSAGSTGSASFSWSLGNTSIVNFNTSADQSSSQPNLLGVAAGTTTASLFASENGCQSSGPGNPSPTVQTPDHLVVLSDMQQTISCGSRSVVQRNITYQMVDASGNAILSYENIRENVPATVSSCTGGPVQTGSVCTNTINYQPGALGEFLDRIQNGCPTAAAPKPCGFTFANQQWQWCPSGGQSKSIGTIGPVNAEDVIIFVDGNSLGFTPGTVFRP
jgi:hypothetical protein